MKFAGPTSTELIFFSFFSVELHDVFESHTFIFLVFELCRNGELFDYLTSVVALSEKKTRYIMKQVVFNSERIDSEFFLRCVTLNFFEGV